MSTGLAQPVAQLARLDRSQIELRLRGCPRLPSLASVNSALRELLSADHRYTSQIAEIIRRDPSLTARLLRLVNSVYYGFSTPINSIEEAVFFLGVRQIRQLAMMTPIIDDLQKLAGETPFDWREFWRHCIAVAMLTREVSGAFDIPGDESDYVAGLVHDVGRIVMASAFPSHFAAIRQAHHETREELVAIECEIFGMDHAELGALYLRSHRLPDLLVETVFHHHAPQFAGRHRRVAAAVEVADFLARSTSVGSSGNLAPVAQGAWRETEGWAILSDNRSSAERASAEAALQRALDRLPSIVEGLV